MNTTLHGDAIYDEEFVDKEIEMEAKYADTWLIKVIDESDDLVDMRSIHIIPEDNKVANDESWKDISTFRNCYMLR